MAFIAPVVGWVAANAGAISATASVIGTGVSAYGAYKQGQAAEAQAKYQSSVANANAMQKKFDATSNETTAKHQAQGELLRGEGQRKRIASKSRRAAAAFTARQTRFGLNLDSVSLKDSLKSFNALNKSEAMVASYDTALKTQALRHEGRGFMHSGFRALDLGKNQSRLFLASGKNQKQSGTLSALGTGFSGMATAAGYLG